MNTNELRRMEEKERELGRKIVEREVRCDMCDGQGFSMFEDPCEKCEGEGRITIWAFECGHDIESDDCEQEGCVEQSAEVAA